MSGKLRSEPLLPFNCIAFAICCARCIAVKKVDASPVLSENCSAVYKNFGVAFSRSAARGTLPYCAAWLRFVPTHSTCLSPNVLTPCSCACPVTNFCAMLHRRSESSLPAVRFAKRHFAKLLLGTLLALVLLNLFVFCPGAQFAESAQR